MSEHDIICPQYQTGIPRGGPGCRCGIINLSRDNERERLRDRVKALPLIDYDKDDHELIRRTDVIALFDLPESAGLDEAVTDED